MKRDKLYKSLEEKGAVVVGKAASKGEVSSAVNEIMKNEELNRKFHIETLTAAYYKLTNVPPSEAVLCEVKLGNSTVFFFDTKDNLFEELTKALSLEVEEELTSNDNTTQ